MRNNPMINIIKRFFIMTPVAFQYESAVPPMKIPLNCPQFLTKSELIVNYLTSISSSNIDFFINFV